MLLTRARKRIGMLMTTTTLGMLMAARAATTLGMLMTATTLGILITATFLSLPQMPCAWISQCLQVFDNKKPRGVLPDRFTVTPGPH